MIGAKKGTWGELSRSIQTRLRPGATASGEAPSFRPTLLAVDAAPVAIVICRLQQRASGPLRSERARLVPPQQLAAVLRKAPGTSAATRYPGPAARQPQSRLLRSPGAGTPFVNAAEPDSECPCRFPVCPTPAAVPRDCSRAPRRGDRRLSTRSAHRAIPLSPFQRKGPHTASRTLSAV